MIPHVNYGLRLLAVAAAFHRYLHIRPFRRVVYRVPNDVFDRAAQHFRRAFNQAFPRRIKLNGAIPVSSLEVAVRNHFLYQGSQVENLFILKIHAAIEPCHRQ
jgi:hypothetical protein